MAGTNEKITLGGETAVAVLRNVRTGERKVIRERRRPRILTKIIRRLKGK